MLQQQESTPDQGGSEPGVHREGKRTWTPRPWELLDGLLAAGFDGPGPQLNGHACELVSPEERNEAALPHPASWRNQTLKMSTAARPAGNLSCSTLHRLPCGEAGPK